MANKKEKLISKEKSDEQIDSDFANEFSDEFDEDFESGSDVGNTNDKAKFIKTLTIIIAIVIGVFLLLFLFSSFIGKNKSFEEIEVIMTNAAKKYYAAHSNELPSRDGSHKDINVAILVSNGYMKDLSSYTSAVCNGSVRVQKIGTNYAYMPKLDCGQAYESDTLANKVREDNQGTNAGYGLYRMGGDSVFRGEKVNNYVKLDNALWRIVKIESSGEVVLTSADLMYMASVWDDRFNVELEYNGGVNNYEQSRLREEVDSLYTSTDRNITTHFLSENDKMKIVPFDSCVGKRDEDSGRGNNGVECNARIRNQMVGLLTASDFMNGSVDPKCDHVTSPSCQNYNYLVSNNAYWISTANPKYTNSVYIVADNSCIKTTTANMYAKIRPVIHLNSAILYKSGSGTMNDPYIVR